MIISPGRTKLPLSAFPSSPDSRLLLSSLFFHPAVGAVHRPFHPLRARRSERAFPFLLLLSFCAAAFSESWDYFAKCLSLPIKLLSPLLAAFFPEMSRNDSYSSNAAFFALVAVTFGGPSLISSKSNFPAPYYKCLFRRKTTLVVLPPRRS